MKLSVQFEEKPPPVAAIPPSIQREAMTLTALEGRSSQNASISNWQLEPSGNKNSVRSRHAVGASPPHLACSIARTNALYDQVLYLRK